MLFHQSAVGVQSVFFVAASGGFRHSPIDIRPAIKSAVVPADTISLGHAPCTLKQRQYAVRCGVPCFFHSSMFVVHSSKYRALLKVATSNKGVATSSKDAFQQKAEIAPQLEPSCLRLRTSAGSGAIYGCD